ncbi:hypothetical protein P4S64_17915 [Vibrio sp. M60_M31a]
MRAGLAHGGVISLMPKEQTSEGEASEGEGILVVPTEQPSHVSSFGRHGNLTKNTAGKYLGAIHLKAYCKVIRYPRYVFMDKQARPKAINISYAEPPVLSR